MKHLTLLLFLFGFSLSFAQAKLLPPKTAIFDNSLSKFLKDLSKAVENEDTPFIVNHLAEEIMVSFGGDGGIQEFKEYWTLDKDTSELWEELKKIMTLGGGPYEGIERYTLPYVFTQWPDDESFDAFEYAAITGSNVNVRDLPSVEGSKVLGQFSYDIVKINYEKTHPEYEDTGWYYVESSTGDLEGYVYGFYVRSPIDYRLGLEKMEGEWKITYLVAGD